MTKKGFPKELLRQMTEAKGGYFAFDTSAAGPFQLPLMEEFEEAWPLVDSGQIVLLFRDHQEQKTYRIPLRARTLSRLILVLTTLDKTQGDALRTNDQKRFSGPLGKQ